jgi:putative restriction endonuclease
MNAYVGITDLDWYQRLAARPGLEEVNFWRPGGKASFKALAPGELFLFKLHAPRQFVVGGGLFAHFTKLPVSLAWDAFREANGARSLAEMRARIERYRREPAAPHDDYTIGCILLEQPFFLPEPLWVPAPADWPRETVQGKRYDLRAEPGRTLWTRVADALRARGAPPPWPPEWREPAAPRYGEPALVRPRLSQGSFRILVTDAYERRCAVTAERVLPVLEAAHIRPYAMGGEHRVDNGLLLRSDLHTLFDRGYLTVTPSLRLEVSRRIREDFENGRDYYAMQGREVRVPAEAGERPGLEFLRWHNEGVFLG